MATFTENGITFSNVKDIGVNLATGPISRNNNYTYNSGETQITTVKNKVINAVDIDWNGANLSSSLGNDFSNISNTSQLMKAIIQASTMGPNNESSSSSSSSSGTNQVPTTVTTIESTNLKIVNSVSDITGDNCIFVIGKTIDLSNQLLTLPENSTLYFQGGQLQNGTIIGKNSYIEAYGKVFDNVAVEGTWRCPGNVGWWASPCKFSPVNDSDGNPILQNIDQTTQVQQALDSAFMELIFPPVSFYIRGNGQVGLTLKKGKKLVLQGHRLKSGLDINYKNIKNTCIIFTDQNIPLLVIDVNGQDEWQYQQVYITGGIFDVSKCSAYMQSCIKVLADNNQRIWGFYIDSCIFGAGDMYNGGTINTNFTDPAPGTNPSYQFTRIGIDINPTSKMDDSTYCGTNKAFITNIHINSLIQNFGIGIKARNYMDYTTSIYYNWCTDLNFDGLITACKVAIDSNVDGDLRGTIQAIKCFRELYNDSACIEFSGDLLSIGTNIYDIFQGYNGSINYNVVGKVSYGNGPYSNRYAINITHSKPTIVPTGVFLSQLIASKWRYSSNARDALIYHYGSGVVSGGMIYDYLTLETLGKNSPN